MSIYHKGKMKEIEIKEFGEEFLQVKLPLNNGWWMQIKYMETGVYYWRFHDGSDGFEFSNIEDVQTDYNNQLLDIF